MTQEEKILLLKDLCARLPYGVQCKKFEHDKTIDVTYTSRVSLSNLGLEGFATGKFELKPYLRPMSSMTEEEKKEYESFFSVGEYSCGGPLNGEEYEYIADDYNDVSQSVSLIDWLIANHFDYRGLIPMGLALEAPEGMYN